MQTANQTVPRTHLEIKLTSGQEARFWSKVNKDGPVPDQSNPHYAGLDQCWLWTAGKTNSGYGKFWVKGKTILSHRIAWTLANGQIPNGEGWHGTCVCHRCEVKICCNPAHYFLGTQYANVVDMMRKNRQAKGDANGTRLHPEKLLRGALNNKTKLTVEQVLEIRALYAAGGTSFKKLSAQFGVVNSVIGYILNRRTWKHI